MTAKPPSTAPRASSPQAGPNPAPAVGAQAAIAGAAPASPSAAPASPGHMPANALVHVENLTKRYRTTTALRDFSLDLPAGHIVGLMGPNGCGKTTLLKILAGVLADYSGVVAIDGHAPGVATKKIVSYLPDADFLNPPGTPGRPSASTAVSLRTLTPKKPPLWWISSTCPPIARLAK